ncbi:MAG: hypothetical protein NTX03_02925, partial [Bacteroidetes bacterium]|nr:hypothetical protein [Bacteroidota bacterium]
KKDKEDLTAKVEDSKKEINKLVDKNITYGNKVYMGSMLKAENLTVTPVRFKGNGKERETNKASQIQKVKICFDIPENHVADGGTKTIYIKVIDPGGITVNISSLGSGKFSFEGAESLYTTKDEILYDNMPKNYCMYWGFAKDAHLHEGIYKLELYGEGYKMGEKNFTVK